MVHGMFDNNMSFTGDTLTVCGPIFWHGTSATDLPASQITLLHVSVVQPDASHPFHAAPGTVITPSSPDPNEWMVDIDGKWTAGPGSAHAHVKIAVEGRARQWIFETWSETITIFEVV
jgi:hypothetical protein